MPGISIQIPLYNTEKYIGPCLRSIRDAVPPDTEILILDDCSTDRSPDIVREHAAEDSRIRYEKMPQQSGVAEVRRRLVEMTDAELLVPFDSDDYMLPEAVVRQRQLLTAHPGLAAVYGKSVIFFWQSEGKTYLRGCPFSPMTLHLSNPIKHGSIMYRRDAALAAGNYLKTSRGEGKKEVALDLFLWERLALVGPVLYDDCFSMLYRLHPKQLSAREDLGYRQAYQFLDNWLIDRDRPLWNGLNSGAPVSLTPPQFPLIMQFLGIMAFRLDPAGPEYLKVLEAAERLDPDDPMIRLYRCKALTAGGQFREAADLSGQLLERCRHDAYLSAYASDYRWQSLVGLKAGEETAEAARVEALKHSERYFGAPGAVERLIAATILKYGGEEVR